jgi:methylmalonyl-CoA/ethylmalonyl-CoA epimerase
MITKFNHVAIVVPNLDEAAQKYKIILGAKVSKSFDYLEHGVSVVFVELDNTKIELMHPYGDKSPIKSFLEKNKSGAMHHICIEVKDIFKACEEMKKNGVRVLGDGTPKNGAHNKPVIFLHPKDFFGTLIELEQE